VTEARRTCPHCKLALPLSAFNVNRRKASGRQSRCRTCDRAAQRAYSLRLKIKHLLAERAIPEWDLTAVVDILEPNKRSPR